MGIGLFNPKNADGRKPEDRLVIGPKGIELHLDPEGIVREAQAAGKFEELQQTLEAAVLPEIWRLAQDRARELGTSLEALSPEVRQKLTGEFRLIYLNALDDFGRQELTFSLPGYPVVRGFSEVMNREETAWQPDDLGLPSLPYYRATRRDKTHIMFTFSGPPDQTLTAAALWTELGRISTETVDVFEILLAHLGSEHKAKITPEEIAAYRGRTLRGGSKAKLLDDLRDHVIRIASIGITMRWENKKTGEVFTCGKPIPDRLLHIVGWEYERGDRTWTAFTYERGEALSRFVKWTGRGHKALLRLDPYRYALDKKVGRYWMIIGAPAANKGYPARPKIQTVMDFCGEKPDYKHPGRTVKRMAGAFDLLWEIGVMQTRFNLETLYKGFCKGDFQRWLETILSAMELSPNIAKIQKPEPPKTTYPGRKSPPEG
jgi:hypothetical protein